MPSRRRQVRAVDVSESVPNRYWRLYRWTGLIMVFIGAQALLLFPAGLPTLPALFPGGNDAPLYLLATFGSAAIAWGWMLAWGARQIELHELLGVPTAIGFYCLAAMRLFAWLGSQQIHEVAGALVLAESTFFGVLGSFFLIAAYQRELLDAGARPVGPAERLQHLLGTSRQLPVWVLVWVFIVLAPVNTAGFFLMDTLIGRWTAIAFAFVIMTNGTLALVQCRISGLMSIPHLVVWIPLILFVGVRLVDGAALAPGERAFGWLVLIVNSISVVFDVNDTRKWFAGERHFLWPADCEAPLIPPDSRFRS